MALLPADRPSDSQIESHATFLAGWLLPQLVALTISAFRIPLWARFPEAGEAMALPLMLAVQIATAALLFPMFRNCTNATMALLAAWPMILIASTLGSASLTNTIAGEAHVGLWIVALATAAIACRSMPPTGIVWVIAIAWSLGGGLLLYLRLEFNPNADSLDMLLSGPLVGAIRAATADFTNSWWPPLIPTAISAVFLVVSRRFQRAAKLR